MKYVFAFTVMFLYNLVFSQTDLGKQCRPIDQGLHCLQFLLHLKMHYSKENPSCSTFMVITANFRVSEILGFLR